MSIAPTLEAERAAPELLPCPFCGGKAEIFETATKFAVECDNAECSVNPDALATFKHEAIEAWNRRTAAPVAEGVALPPLDAETVRDSTWRNLLDAVLREFPRNMGRSNNGNAPGHCHSRPGIWDDDNGAIAGKPCAWCIAWNGAAQALAAATSPLPPQEEANG